MKIRQEEEKRRKKRSSSSVMMVLQEVNDGNEGAVRELQRKKKESEDGRRGKTVVVGIRMDAEGRELLTWSLVKVADAGDRVVALHVLPSALPAADSSAAVAGCASLLSLVRAFDATLAAYEGFCNLKQVELKMKIARGSSVRKVLVREAVSYGAGRLVVGVANTDHAIGYFSTSIAKYCSRKLPRDCSVFAVSNGKILFKREACFPASHSHHGGNKEFRSRTENGASAASAAQQALTRGYSKLLNLKAERKQAIARSQSETISSSLFSWSPRRCPDAKKSSSNCGRDHQLSLALVPLSKPEPSPSCSLSLLSRVSSGGRPGWPLLRKAVLPDRKTSPSADGSRISVVQWAMRLPCRLSEPASVHPNLDKERGAIIAVNEADSPNAPEEEEKKVTKQFEVLWQKYSSVCRPFSYKEIAQMTSNFSAERLIGKGGSSRVYRGSLADGRELAVKILKPTEAATDEFVSEVEIITALHHKNIVSLVGFCFGDDGGNLALVYDYLQRGSLEDALHGESWKEEEKKMAVGWAERYKVAVGVAEALVHLHESARPVIHRDVKSSNILLADDFEPQLADFGLAMWASASGSQLICDDVAGTFGYLAPEYFMYGKVNEKIDVYAFGVVLLELISGRKPVRSGCPKGQESLVMWAMPILQGGEGSKEEELVDPSLGTCYDKAQLERMILAASLCIKRAPRSRSPIKLVLRILQGGGDDEILRWARSQVSTGADDEAAFHDDDDNSNSNILRSHINLALQDVEDDSLSTSSSVGLPPIEGSSLEEYLQGRWSRSSSFD